MGFFFKGNFLCIPVGGLKKCTKCQLHEFPIIASLVLLFSWFRSLTSSSILQLYTASRITASRITASSLFVWFHDTNKRKDKLLTTELFPFPDPGEDENEYTSSLSAAEEWSLEMSAEGIRQWRRKVYKCPKSAWSYVKFFWGHPWSSPIRKTRMLRMFYQLC